MGLSFEWDPRKATANEKKHGVAFNEASTVFGDPLGWFQPDPEHSVAEDRSLLLGRIISARCATPAERRKYEEDFR